jgi:4-deoxy-L-threo-5-hexosulose-uronate ketol-isomerase
VIKPFKPMISPRPAEVSRMTTDELRRAFVIENVVSEGKLAWTFTDLDRMAVGGVRPGGKAVALDNDPETGADFFLARRELGVINVGGRGSITVDGKKHDLANLDCIYIGMGAKNVSFEGGEAKFFLLSCPAHQSFPTTVVRKDQLEGIALGAQATANQRKIYQYIHPAGIKSAQLVMGFTELAEGSVWNTMPPHTHSRRTEIYFYFDIKENHIVSHFLGAPDSSRHVFLHNEQAVLSPPWSIHCGCGTAAYKFIWAMAGENQVFDDMDKMGPLELK